ncbi:MAG: hypothetical protein H6604_09840 [Flavobacteriales bacterium]|nr:hypothetical protein [Flavobacteriales bacterium]
MKSKIKISLLILTCFTLMGCPPGHFHEYKFIGTELPHDGLAYTRIEFNNETDLHIKTGYYYEFIHEKENGLATVIKVNPNYDLSKDNVVRKVKSSIYGQLEKMDSLPYTARVYDTANTLMYNLTFEKRNERKTLKKIENDTISIELTNGKTLQFVRKTTE